jgi:hypothetical protein
MVRRKIIVKAKATFEVDKAILKEVSGCEDIKSALEQEFGWIVQSGIVLIDFEIAEEDEDKNRN